MRRLLTLTALLATLAGGVAYAAAPTAPRSWWDRSELRLHASIILLDVAYEGRQYTVDSYHCYPSGPSLRSPRTGLPASGSFACNLEATTLGDNWEGGGYLATKRVALTGTLTVHQDGSGTFHAASSR